MILTHGEIPFMWYPRPKLTGIPLTAEDAKVLLEHYFSMQSGLRLNNEFLYRWCHLYII